MKIGVAQNPSKRLRTLQCAHHEPLRIIRCATGAHKLEAWLRSRFKADHIRGEWHRFNPEMLTIELRGADVGWSAERNRERARERGRAKSATWKPREPGLAGFGGDTVRAYDKAWRAFCGWRGGEGVPVGTDELLRYLDEVLVRRSPKSVANRLAGLSTVHVLKGHDRLSRRPEVRAWLKRWRGEGQ